jgi:nucleoside-diphosphate-sugar epimerase
MGELKVFITGGTGFVGRNLVEYLCQKVPPSSLSCLARSEEKARPLHALGCRVVMGDLLNPKTYAEACSQADVILHVAALVGLKNGPEFYTVNTEGMRQLLSVAKNAPGLKRLVFVSSISAIDRVFPHSEDTSGPLMPLTEESPAQPGTDYGKSKRQAEELLMASGLPYTILRPSYIYGPYPRVQSSMDRLIYDIRDEKPYTRFPFPGRASEIYVTDLAQGIWHTALHPGALNQDFFIANPHPVSVTRFFEALAQALHVQYRPRQLSPERLERVRRRMYRQAPTEPMRRILYEDFFVCDASKLSRLTGYAPALGFESGIAQTVAWYQEQPGWQPAPSLRT